MNKHKTEEIKHFIEDKLSPQNVNILICCASFEERSKIIPLKIPSKSINHALICEHEEVENIVKENASLLRSHFGKRAKKVVLSLSKPIKTLDSLIAVISKLKSNRPKTFWVDITTFTHESLLILLKLLSFFCSANDSIKILYSSAGKYSIDSTSLDDSTDFDSLESELDTKKKRWLSKGIREIRSVVGFPGILLPSRKLHLIVLSGYEEDRAAKIIDNYEANYVSIGIGDKNESIHPDLFEINQAFHKRLCAFYRNAETFSFSLTNPLNTRENIISQINKHPNCNTIIAPLNTKISTVGVALTALRNREIQLAYAQVNYYNFDDYSTPGHDFYLFDLPSFANPKASSKASNEW